MRGRSTVVVAVSMMVAGVGMIAGAAPATADTLPQGRTKWQSVTYPGPKPVVILREGERVKMRSWQGYDRRHGYWLKQSGSVKGHVLRLYTHEGYGGWSKARYRLQGKNLRIKWQGQSKWVVFKRV